MEDDRRLLIDMVTKLLTDHCGPDVVAAAEGDWAPQLWEQLEQAGLTAIGVPEESGGSGGGTADAAAIVRVAARFAAPVPLAETILLSGWLRSLAGLTVTPGPATVVVDPDGDGLLLREDAAGGWRLNGDAPRVPWARCVRSLTVLARREDGEHAVAIVGTDAVITDPGTNLAGEPRDHLRFDDVRLPGGDVAAVSGVTPAMVRDRGALVSVLLMAGALERTLALTCQYAQEREQFGRPIASFQAIKQQIALLAGEVAAAVAVSEAALASADGARAGFEIAAAKLRAARAATIATEIAHQVHGAIGFTREHQLQHFTRRLWSWRDEHGAEGNWETRLGRQVVDVGADGLWALVVGA